MCNAAKIGVEINQMSTTNLLKDQEYNSSYLLQHHRNYKAIGLIEHPPLPLL